MANLFDYLDWRGDLSFEEAALNDIDALILSRLSFLPFEDIVPSSLVQTITVAEAAKLFFQSEEAQENVIMRLDLRFLSDVATKKRFSHMELCGYTNQVDPEAEKQFAALVIKVAPAAFYISYRGTDLSLAGWKEDFNMSFCTPVPAQKEALLYLNQVGAILPGQLMVGGHSKGGNVAVYASSFCDPSVQERIVSVYNHDGPGFDGRVLESDGYQRIAKRVKTFVPQSSVVGMLLQHEEDYFVIDSSQIGLMQHDLFSWEVDGDDFVYLEEVTKHSKFIDRTLKTWISTLNPEQREQFVDALFSIFEETKATTLRELTTNWHVNARVLLKSIQGMDDEMRSHISQALGLLFEAAKKNAPRPNFLQNR